MFRLVKMLSNDSISENVFELNVKMNGTPILGSALSCTNNILSCAASDAFPDYILKASPENKSTFCCSMVTDDMVFKVEYTSAMAPKIGMKVGITDKNGPSDAVSYSSSGKGIIIGVINKNMVYVKFQKG